MATEDNLSVERLVDVLKVENSTCYVRREKVKLYDMDPWEFLSFARQDLEEDSERGWINALTNAKRAIECRADELLTLLNFRCFSSRHRWGLAYKLQVLRTFNISAPDILMHYITSKRNLLEHEYVRPREREQIRYVADIVELFLKASDKYVENGYVASATINCLKGEPLETRDRAKTTRVVDADQYELEFNLQDEVLTITYQQLEETNEDNYRIGELRSWREARSEKTRRSLSIRDCSQEGVRELMKLIAERQFRFF